MPGRYSRFCIVRISRINLVRALLTFYNVCAFARHLCLLCRLRRRPNVACAPCRLRSMRCVPDAVSFPMCECVSLWRIDLHLIIKNYLVVLMRPTSKACIRKPRTKLLGLWMCVRAKLGLRERKNRKGSRMALWSSCSLIMPVAVRHLSGGYPYGGGCHDGYSNGYRDLRVNNGVYRNHRAFSQQQVNCM